MKSNKQLSKDQENYVADILGGRRTAASGAALHDPGDVVAPDWVVECKVSRTKGIVVSKVTWEKIRSEAHTGRRPLMALRFVDEYDNVMYNLIVVDANDFVELLSANAFVDYLGSAK